jgi:uncharacterized protein (TIGR02284 family)
MMADTNEALTGVLTGVVDSAQGYEEAAEVAGSGALQSIFNERARMRRRFAGELRNELKRHGAAADDDGSLLASAHRAFMDIKSAVGDSRERVLEEVERGEQHLVAQYEEGLGAVAPDGSAHHLLQEQLRCVRQDLQSAKQLHDAVS